MKRVSQIVNTTQRNSLFIPVFIDKGLPSHHIFTSTDTQLVYGATPEAPPIVTLRSKCSPGHSTGGLFPHGKEKNQDMNQKRKPKYGKSTAKKKPTDIHLGISNFAISCKTRPISNGPRVTVWRENTLLDSHLLHIRDPFSTPIKRCLGKQFLAAERNLSFWRRDSQTAFGFEPG